MSQDPADHPLERLANLILKGDVVFFIGAGFSIDSEGNSARRMMRRLILQLLAFVGAGVDGADDLFRDFVGKFNLDPGHMLPEAETAQSARVRWLTIGGLKSSESTDGVEQPKLGNAIYEVDSVLDDLPTYDSSKGLLRRLLRALGEWPIQRLSREYYPANEWFCRAFETLLARDGDDLSQIHGHAEELRREMNTVLRNLGQEDEQDHAPLPAVELWLRKEHGLSRSIAGKALFLDTLGFRDPAVMGGSPRAQTLDEVAASYHDRLFARHHVLARFAREGWCSTLITTNFDLLLEGAYRLAGFAKGEESSHLGPRFPETLVSSYEIVASAREFFRKAKSFRTAVLVKMHGCADRYRSLAKEFDRALKALAVAGDAERTRVADEVRAARLALEECIRTLVFTYREIQNWRGDSWAADYLRTVLRTRTVVFCGYSVSDPVIHDTFRSAFEEMARITGDTGGKNGTRIDAHSAPLFFFDVGAARSFHSEAVLNAATEAVGASPDHRAGHPNRIPFYFRTRHRNGKFPDLDEAFRWLQHLTWRERQRECVTQHLARTAAILAGSGEFRQRRRDEVDEVVKNMNDVFQRERGTRGCFAADIRSHQEARSRLDSTVAWTERFHAALLREFACAEDARRLRMPNLQVATMRRHEWYFPTMENPAWTCWGVVVELALREVAATRDCRISVAECTRPTVFFAGNQSGERRTPWALTVEFSGVERETARSAVLGNPRYRVIWKLRTEDAPWPISKSRVASKKGPNGGEHVIADDSTHVEFMADAGWTTYQDAPPGELLWRLAMGRTSKNDETVRTGLDRFFAVRG